MKKMILAEAIKTAIEKGYINGNSAKFAYINGILLVNQIGLNLTTNKLKMKLGNNYRDKLTTTELQLLDKAEKLVVLFLNTGVNLKQIKKIFSNANKKGKRLIEIKKRKD